MKCWFLLPLIFWLGCSHHAATIQKNSLLIDERGREHVAAAKIANDLGRASAVQSKTALASGSIPNATNHLSSALRAYDLSADFLRREQNLIGLPLEDQSCVVASLLSDNDALRSQALDFQSSQELQEATWRAQLVQAESRLQELGAKYEAEHNRSIFRRMLASFGILGTLGIVIAACILCPALIPLIFRLGAWLVSKIPVLASALGVVSKKAFDQVLIGVQNAKTVLASTPSGVSAVEVLRTELAQAVDSDHKTLISTRKATLQPLFKQTITAS